MPPPSPPSPTKGLTIHVLHLEEESGFAHGAAVGERPPQLLEQDGATSIQVKQGKESLNKEGLCRAEGETGKCGHRAGLWIHSLRVCVCACCGVVGFREHPGA